MLVDTSCFFECETCTHNGVNGCDTFCDTGESYSPSIQKLMPINDGDFLMREEVIQEVLSQMAISLSPEAMRERLLNLQGVSIQKHGRWERNKYDRMVCSECNTEPLLDDFGFWYESAFCPKCGAKMDGV